MRTLVVALCLALACGVALAGEAKAHEGKGKTHDATATIVSVDAAAKTVTLKDESGETKTAPVTGTAIESLKTLKAGDHVTVTCKDDEHGNHKAITAIKVTPEAPAK